MKSGIQGIIIALISTLVIYSLVKNNNPNKFSLPKIFTFRFLSNRTTEEISEYMCSQSSSDLEEFYKTTEADYEFNPPESSGFLKELIKGIIEGTTKIENLGKDQVKEYFSNSPSYIFALVLFILFLILWLPYCLCICCKCCLFFPQGCLKCPKIYMIIGIALCALILVNCFIGYSENSSIVNGIYGLGCSFLKIEQHLIKGDDNRVKKPYWVGINGILSLLKETSNNITALKTKTANLKDQLNVIDISFKTFSQDLTKEYNKRYNTEIKNPIPNGNDFIPDYLSLYGPITNEETALGLINKEKNAYHDYTFSVINEVVYVIGNATEKTTTITDNIQTISNDLDTKVNEIDTTIGNTIRKFDDYLDEIDSYARTYMNLLFSVNLVVVLVIGASLILLLLCKRGKPILCISWIILYSFMLFSFLLGGILGIIGSFVQDISSCAIETVKDIKNIEKLNQDTRNMADICINGNGSLAHLDFISSNINTSIIDNVYNLEENLNDGIKAIRKYNLQSIESNENKYNEIMDRPKNFVKELYYALNNLQNYTDSSLPNTYVSTSTPIHDEWEVNENDCKYYNYTKSTKTRRLTEEPQRCLIISEWNLKDALDLYKNIEPRDKSINLTQQIENHFNSIKSFLSSNNELISAIKEQNKIFNQSFINIGEEEINVLNNIKNIIIPFRDTYNEIVGDKSIFEILNCNFLKRDVNKVIEILYDSFGSTFKVTSTLFIMISAYEIAITLVVLIVIASLNKQNKSKEIDYEKDK